MSYTMQMVGSLQSDPASVLDATSLLSQSIDLAFKQTFDASFSASPPIAGTFVPALGAVTKVRALAVRAVDGQSLVIQVSSAAGVNQSIPCSDLFVLLAKNPGDELTAISITGTGRIEYIIGGNKT